MEIELIKKIESVERDSLEADLREDNSTVINASRTYAIRL